MILAPAKINLTLSITGKRHDGLHLIRSLVCFADLCDRISLTPNNHNDDRLNIIGPQAKPLMATKAQNNIILKALTLYRQTTGRAGYFDIELYKNIPVAAGMGGGSADAAATLIGINNHHGKLLDDTAMALLGLSLGADVPVCLASHGTMAGKFWQMQGIGEDLSPVNTLDGNTLENNDFGLILTNPMAAVSTAKVFARFSENTPPPHTNASDFINWRSDGNDLCAAACAEVPIIKTHLTALAGLCGSDGYLKSGMSGSGATSFAVFTTAAAAKTAAATLAPPEWIWVGGLYHQQSAASAMISLTAATRVEKKF